MAPAPTRRGGSRILDALESFYAANAPYLWAGTTAVLLLVLVMVVALQARVGRLVARQRRLMAGVEGGTVAEALEREIARIDETSGRAARLEALLHRVDAQVDRAIQR